MDVARTIDDAVLATIATDLRRLADPRDAEAAAAELINAGVTRGDDDRDASVPIYARAIATLGDDADALVAAWVERFVDRLRATAAWHAALERSLQAGGDMPDLASLDIIVGVEVGRALRAAGERLTPHVDRLIDELRAMQRDGGPTPTARRDNADAILDVLCAAAGPALVRARGALLDELRVRGVWSRPSNVLKAIARLAEFDPAVVDAIRAMLDDAGTRGAAIDALGAIGVAAGDATPELLAFRDADVTTRYRSIYAMSRLGPPTPAVLDAFEAAFDDASVEVRMSVTIALRQRTPAPARFVPRLIAMCDDAEPVHDYVVPEEAIATLGAYGPAARDALPRLVSFLSGPIAGRDVEPAIVERAIEAIAGRPAIEVVGVPAEPALRATPVVDDAPLWPITYRGRLAYVDARGEIVLVTMLADGGRFDGGRAIARDDEGVAHVIDRRGAVVFRSEWRRIERFREGRAAVRRGEHWGFVDLDGRVVVEPQYDSATAFREGLAGVEVGRTEVSLGKHLSRDRAGRRGFIDLDGRVVIPIDRGELGVFSEGLAAACTREAREPDGATALVPPAYGYIDRAGRRVIDGRYDFPQPFREGFAAVSRGAWTNRERHGYVDRTGREAIPLEFKRADAFRDGLAIVQRRGRRRRDVTLLLDPRGNVVWESTLPNLAALGLGLFSFWDGRAFGIVDRAGATVAPPQFDRVEPFADGLAEVERGKWYGLIGPAGRLVYGPVTGRAVDGVIRGDWTR